LLALRLAEGVGLEQDGAALAGRGGAVVPRKPADLALAGVDRHAVDGALALQPAGGALAALCFLARGKHQAASSRAGAPRTRSSPRSAGRRLRSLTASGSPRSQAVSKNQPR